MGHKPKIVGPTEKEVRLKRRKAHPIEVNINDVPRLKAALAMKPVKKPAKKKPAAKKVQPVDTSEWSPLITQTAPVQDVALNMAPAPIAKVSWWKMLGFRVGQELHRWGLG